MVSSLKSRVTEVHIYLNDMMIFGAFTHQYLVGNYPGTWHGEHGHEKSCIDLAAWQLFKSALADWAKSVESEYLPFQVSE